MAQPAIPQDLKSQVIIYRRRTTGVANRSPKGQKLYTFVKLKTVKVAVKRSRSSQQLLQHTETTNFEDHFVGNWWDWMDVKDDDVIKRISDGAEFGLKGPPVNFQQVNRWAIMELVASNCLAEGGVGCEDAIEPPPGTEDVDQDLVDTQPEVPAE